MANNNNTRKKEKKRLKQIKQKIAKKELGDERQVKKQAVKFKSFSDRIKSLNVDVSHQIDTIDNKTETDTSSYFLDALVERADLDCTSHFEDFKHEIHPYVQTLPELLYNKEKVVDVLLKHLTVPESLALPSLLHLTYVLARDLRAEFYPLFGRIFDTLVELLDPSNFENTESVFVALAHLFKYLTKQLRNDLAAWFERYTPLLGHQRWYIRKFAAESFSYLIRKLSSAQLSVYFDKMFAVLSNSPTEELFDGVSLLFFDSMKGVYGHFHSRMTETIMLLFRKLDWSDTAATNADDATRVQDIQHRFMAIQKCNSLMIEHARSAKTVEPLVACFVHEINSLTSKFIESSKSQSTTTAAETPIEIEQLGVQLGHILSLFTQWVEKRFVSAPEVLELVNVLVEPHVLHSSGLPERTRDVILALILALAKFCSTSNHANSGEVLLALPLKQVFRLENAALLFQFFSQITKIFMSSRQHSEALQDKYVVMILSYCEERLSEFLAASNASKKRSSDVVNSSCSLDLVLSFLLDFLSTCATDDIADADDAEGDSDEEGEAAFLRDTKIAKKPSLTKLALQRVSLPQQNQKLIDLILAILQSQHKSLLAHKTVVEQSTPAKSKKKTQQTAAKQSTVKLSPTLEWFLSLSVRTSVQDARRQHSDTAAAETETETEDASESETYVARRGVVETAAVFQPNIYWAALTLISKLNLPLTVSSGLLPQLQTMFSELCDIIYAHKETSNKPLGNLIIKLASDVLIAQISLWLHAQRVVEQTGELPSLQQPSTKSKKQQKKSSTATNAAATFAATVKQAFNDLFDQCLEFVRKLGAVDLSVLKAYNFYLKHYILANDHPHGFKLPEQRIQSELLTALRDNLLSELSDVRLYTLKIVTRFQNLPQLSSSDSAFSDRKQQQKQQQQQTAASETPCTVLDLCKKVEKCGIRFSTEREKSYQLERVATMVAARLVPKEYLEVLSRLVLGMLFTKFSPVWPKCAAIALAIYKVDDALFWSIFHPALKQWDYYTSSSVDTHTHSVGFLYRESRFNPMLRFSQYEKALASTSMNKEAGTAVSKHSVSAMPSVKELRSAKSTYTNHSSGKAFEHEEVMEGAASDEGASVTIYSDSHKTDLNRKFFKSFRSSPLHTDYITYFGLLWDILTSMKRIAQDKSEDVVALFVDFYKRELAHLFNSSDSDVAQALTDEQYATRSVASVVTLEEKTQKKLEVFLKFFAGFELESMADADTLKAIFYRLLNNGQSTVQQLALSCLAKFGIAWLKPYIGYLSRITGVRSKTHSIKQLSIKSAKVRADHRPYIVPLVLTLLEPTLASIREASQQKKKQSSHRSRTWRASLVSILEFVSQLESEEITIFMNRLLQPFYTESIRSQVQKQSTLLPNLIDSQEPLLRPNMRFARWILHIVEVLITNSFVDKFKDHYNNLIAVLLRLAKYDVVVATDAPAHSNDVEVDDDSDSDAEDDDNDDSESAANTSTRSDVDSDVDDDDDDDDDEEEATDEMDTESAGANDDELDSDEESEDDDSDEEDEEADEEEASEGNTNNRQAKKAGGSKLLRMQKQIQHRAYELIGLFFKRHSDEYLTFAVDQPDQSLQMQIEPKRDAAAAKKISDAKDAERTHGVEKAMLLLVNELREFLQKLINRSMSKHSLFSVLISWASNETASVFFIIFPDLLTSVLQLIEQKQLPAHIYQSALAFCEALVEHRMLSDIKITHVHTCASFRKERDVSALEGQQFGAVVFQPLATTIVSAMHTALHRNRSKGMSRARAMHIVESLERYFDPAVIPVDKLLDLYAFALADLKTMDDDAAQKLLGTFRRYIHRAGSAARDRFIRSLAMLLKRNISEPLRQSVCEAFAQLGQINEQLAFVAKVVLGLNAFTAERLDKREYSERYKTYEMLIRVTDPTLRTLNEVYMLPIVCNLLHFIYDTEWLIRDSSAKAIASIIKLIKKRTEGDNAEFAGLKSLLTASVREALQNESVLQANEMLVVLGEMTREFSDFADLGRLQTAKFFELMADSKPTSKVSAIEILTQAAKEQPFSSRHISTLFVPLLSSFLYSGKRSLEQPARTALAAISRNLSNDWDAFYGMLRVFIGDMMKPTKRDAAIHVVSAMLERFPFQLQLTPEEQQLLAKMNKPAAIKKPSAPETAVESDANKDEFFTEAEDEENEESTGADNQMDESTATEEEEDDDDVDVDMIDAAAAAEDVDPEEAALRKALATKHRMKRSLMNEVIPRLEQNLWNAKGEISTMRMHIAILLIKFLRMIGKVELNRVLSRTINEIIAKLRSKNSSQRETARKTLVAVVRELGSEYLAFTIQKLKDTMTMGYQVPVMYVTLYSLLSSSGVIKPEDAHDAEMLDHALDAIVQLLVQDITTPPQKALKLDMKEKIVTMDHKKTFELFQILGSQINFVLSIEKFVAPLEDVLRRVKNNEMIGKVKEAFNRLALGLKKNPSLNEKDLLIWIFTKIRDKGLDRKEFKRKAEDHRYYIKREIKDMKKENFELPKEPGRRGAIDIDDDRMAQLAGDMRATDYVIVNFCAKLIESGLRSEAVSSIEMLDPFVDVFTRLLRVRNTDVSLSSLRVLALLTRLNLPSLSVNMHKIAAALFDMLNNTPESAEETWQELFDAIRFLMTYDRYAFTDSQMELLLDRMQLAIINTKIDIHAYLLLHAIVTKKLVYAQVYDLMQQKIRTTMLTSSNPHIQDICMKLLTTFFVHYPMTNDVLQEHITFLLTHVMNESTLPHSGRLAVLRMVDLLIKRLPDLYVEERMEVFLFPLIVQLSNDKDVQCRELLSVTIKHLLTQVREAAFNKAIAAVLKFYSDPKLQAVALQVLGLVVEMLGTKKAAKYRTTITDLICNSMAASYKELAALPEPPATATADDESSSSVRQPKKQKQQQSKAQQEAAKTAATKERLLTVLYYGLLGYEKLYQGNVVPHSHIQQQLPLFVSLLEHPLASLRLVVLRIFNRFLTKFIGNSDIAQVFSLYYAANGTISAGAAGLDTLVANQSLYATMKSADAEQIEKADSGANKQTKKKKASQPQPKKAATALTKQQLELADLIPLEVLLNVQWLSKLGVLLVENVLSRNLVEESATLIGRNLVAVVRLLDLLMPKNKKAAAAQKSSASSTMEDASESESESDSEDEDEQEDSDEEESEEEKEPQKKKSAVQKAQILDTASKKERQQAAAGGSSKVDAAQKLLGKISKAALAGSDFVPIDILKLRKVALLDMFATLVNDMRKSVHRYMDLIMPAVYRYAEEPDIFREAVQPTAQKTLAKVKELIEYGIFTSAYNRAKTRFVERRTARQRSQALRAVVNPAKAELSKLKKNLKTKERKKRKRHAEAEQKELRGISKNLAHAKRRKH